MRHVTLPVFDDAQRRYGPTAETLTVEEAGEGLVRLAHSPAFVDGVARDDVVRLRQDLPCGYEVVDRSGFVAAVVAFGSREQRAGPEAPRLARAAEALGGVCDGGPEQLLVLSLPVTAGFEALGALFDGLDARAPGSTWWFGNVSDPLTGQPLGWWRRRG